MDGQDFFGAPKRPRGIRKMLFVNVALSEMNLLGPTRAAVDSKSPLTAFEEFFRAPKRFPRIPGVRFVSVALFQMCLQESSVPKKGSHEFAKSPERICRIPMGAF